MLISEIAIDSPILADAMAATEGLGFTYEEGYRMADGRIRVLVWAEGADDAAVERALDGDPTVDDPTLLYETPTRRLYRVEYVGRGREATIFTALSELDTVLLDAVGTDGEWRLRLQVPGREEIHRLRDHCRNRGMSFRLLSVYDHVGNDGRVAPSADQREALVAALEAGYFEIPREASLSDVADRLGIASQSASERLRRGTATLVRTTLADGDLNP